MTTHSGAMKFSEWQDGEWVVLFSHPAGFTPVCGTELAEFALGDDDFAAIGVKLIGSVWIASTRTWPGCRI